MLIPQHQQRYLGAAIVTVVVIVLIAMLGIEFLTINSRHSLVERFKNFERQRELIELRERYQYLGGRIKLSLKETIVNTCIVTEKLLDREEKHSHWNSDVPAVGDVYSNRLFDYIQSRPLFKLLKSMPKGAALHVNGLSMVASDYLIELSYEKDLWICVRMSNEMHNNNGQEYLALRFARLQPTVEVESPCEWLLLQELRLRDSNVTVDEKLRRHFQLSTGESLNMLPQYERFVIGLVSFKPVWLRYIFRALAELSMDNVQYVEIHTTLPTLYDLDGSNYTYLDTARSMMETAISYSTQDREFSGAMIIYATPSGYKDKDYDHFLKRALRLKSTFPTFFAGINIANNGKSGRILRTLGRQLLAVQDQLSFYYHPDGTVAHLSDDDDSIKSAVLMGSKRIRHNSVLLRHPELNRLLYRRNVGIEVHLLTLLNSKRYTLRKLENHPISYYFATGFPLIITSQYAPYKNVTPLTHDFYLAYVGVIAKSANIGTLKQLAWNSIQYSSLDIVRKQKVYQSWSEKWNNWIDMIIDSEC